MFLSKGPVFLSKGFLEDIHKWRLITLLNTSYKIFAKLLSFRLQELQPKIIHESQTRFMWERSIMDNGLTFWEAIVLEVKIKQNLTVLFDVRKGYGS